MIIEACWDFDRKVTLCRLHFAGGHELVVVGDNGNQFLGRDIIGFEAQRVYGHFDHFIALPRELCFQDRLKPVQAVLELFGVAHERALWHGACEVYDQDRKFGKVDFIDGIAVRALRKLGLDAAHTVAHIRDHFGFVPTKLKFHGQTAVALCGGA